MTTAHVVSDVQLMRIRLVRWPRRPLYGIRYCSLWNLARAIAQRKAVHTVDLTGKQAVLRFAEHQFAVEQHFTQGYVRLPGYPGGCQYRTAARSLLSLLRRASCQPSWLVMVSPGLNITRVIGESLRELQTVFADGWEK